MEIVSAISRGFSPERSYRLLAEDVILQIVDLNEYVGRSHNQIARLKGRIIGEGENRKTIENLTGTNISIYGHTVGIIGGNFEDIKLASDAILHLIKGSSHKTVYNFLQDKRRRTKIDKLYLGKIRV